MGCHPDDLPSIIGHGQKARRGRKTTAANNENPSQFCERHGMSLCAQYALRLIHRKKKKDSACHIYHNTTLLRFFFPCSFLFFGYLFCIIFRPTILITTTSSSTSSTSSLVFRFHTILLVERPTFKVGIHHPFSTIYPIQTLAFCEIYLLVFFFVQFLLY